MKRPQRGVVVSVAALVAGVGLAVATRPEGALPRVVQGIQVIDHPVCPAGYSRHAFGDEPTAATRAKALLAKPGLAPLPAGTVWDAWQQTTIPATSADIDHVRSLHSAWCAGAADMAISNPARARRFAADPQNLVPTSAALNRSKGDQDPDTWRPPTRDAWCDYGFRWLNVTRTYGLTATRAQLRAVAALIKTCPG